jgi:hypothetical protein
VARWIGLGVAIAGLLGAITWGAIEETRSSGSSAGSTSGSGSLTSAPPSGTTKVVTAKDNKSQLTVPDSWNGVPDEQVNELAAIQLGDLRKAQYVLVITGAKTDFDSLEDFSAACLTEARQNVEDAEMGDRRDITIGGLPAAQHQVTGKYEAIKLVYWFTMIEGKNGYYEVVGWTLPSRKSAAEKVILDVINSFRELGVE